MHQILGSRGSLRECGIRVMAGSTTEHGERARGAGGAAWAAGPAGPRGSRGRRVSEGRAPGRAEGGPGPPGFPRRVRSSNPVRALPGPPLPRSSQTSRPPGPPAPRPRGLVLRSPAGRWAGPHRLLPPGIWGDRHSQGRLGPPSPTLTLRNVGPREPDADAREGVGVSRRLSSAAASSGHGDLRGRGVTASP